MENEEIKIVKTAHMSLEIWLPKKDLDELGPDDEDHEECLLFNLTNEVYGKIDEAGIRVLYDKYTDGTSVWDIEDFDYFPDREWCGIFEPTAKATIEMKDFNSIKHIIQFVVDVGDGMTTPNAIQHFSKVDEDALKLGYIYEDEGLLHITNKGKYLILLIGR